MTQDKETKDRTLGLSTAQVTGSALAAMSGAFFVSWAGTAGTLIGAAVGSVIATVGAATYTYSLRRTSEAAKRTAALVKQRALVTGALPRSVAQGPLREDGNEARTLTIDADAPPSAVEEPAEVETRTRRWDLPWAKVALVSLAVMVVGMAGITAIEAVTGKPISSLLGKDAGTGTTVGHVVGDGGSSTQQDRTPKQQDTPAPQESQPSSEPSSEPTPEPQAPDPTTVPDPTTEPNDTPAPPVESQVPEHRHGAVAERALDHWARNFWTSGNGFRPVPVAVLRLMKRNGFVSSQSRR